MPTVTRRLFGTLLAAGGLMLAVPATAPAQAQDKFITVASTTSTEQSGLFGHILPIFEQATGIQVRVVVQGTGQALETGRRGDADVLFVHDTKGEQKFVADGYAAKRQDVMYNDFVIVGPKADPAGIDGLKDVTEGLKRIAAAKSPFISRGDDSGTNRAELRYWQNAGIEVKQASGGWYQEIGQSMGPTLNTAAAMDGYALTDRGTWLSFSNRGTLAILLEGDKRLFNQYGIMLVSPGKYPHVKADLGRRFIDWIVSAEGQKAIASYKINGEQLFFPNAQPAS
jgi:tungstate transport system substrate-binding protein